MKKVCPKCGSSQLHKHGKKRRKCVVCKATCTTRSGRPRVQFLNMYLLDRSTMRRIAHKTKQSAAGTMKHIYTEFKDVPQLLFHTKKFSSL